MKIRKLIALSLASLLAIGAMTACGSSQNTESSSSQDTSSASSQDTSSDSIEEAESSSAEAGSGDVVEISFPTMWVGVNINTEWFQDRLAAFNEQYGDQIQVNVEEIAGDQNYVDKIKVLYSSNSLPDVIFTGGYNLIDSMMDQMVDLTPYIDDELRSHASDVCWDYNTRDGKIYGVPMTREVVGYFYNKDLFAQAGIEEPAETWDEFFEQCDQLLAAGITPLSMDTADSGWVTSLWLGAMIGSTDAGEEFMNTSLPDDYNTPEFIEAATHIQEMFQKYTTSDAIGGAYENAANHFYMEDTAMIANGPWMVGDFYDTSMVEDGFADKVGTAIYPGDLMYNGGKIGYNIASKSDETLQAALTFVDFMTSEESQLKMLEMTGDTPAMEGITSDNVKPLVNEVTSNADSATRQINDFQSLWYANVVDEISVQYPLLAQGEITPEEFAQALTDAAAKN